MVCSAPEAAPEAAPAVPPAPARRGRARIAARYLALALLCATSVYLVLNWRQVKFTFTGTATVGDCTYYLHRTDTLITPLVVKYGEYEPTQTKLIRSRLQPGDVFIDVGANIGWYTVQAGKLAGPTGLVVAFEPDPANFALLRKNAEANGLTNAVLEEKGLSDANGSFNLYLDRENLGRHSLVLKYHEKEYVTVPTVRFDDYWTGDRPIKLVKVDTEGAEGMILAGMRETLKKQKHVELVVEFAPKRLVKSGYDPDKFLQDLYDLGFKAALIDEDHDRLVEMGRPKVKDFNFDPNDEPCINLYFTR